MFDKKKITYQFFSILFFYTLLWIVEFEMYQKFCQIKWNFLNTFWFGKHSDCQYFLIINSYLQSDCTLFLKNNNHKLQRPTTEADITSFDMFCHPYPTTWKRTSAYFMNCHDIRFYYRVIILCKSTFLTFSK